MLGFGWARRGKYLGILRRVYILFRLDYSHGTIGTGNSKQHRQAQEQDGRCSNRRQGIAKEKG